MKALCLALISGSGCFLSSLHLLGQTVLSDLTIRMEIYKEDSRDQTYLYDNTISIL